jgi:hypothetical protein
LDLSLSVDAVEFRLLPERDPIPPGTVTESSKLAFVLRAEHLDAWAWNLAVEGKALEPVTRRAGALEWKWAPGFHAGAARIRLKPDGGPAIRLTVTTDPARKKLTRSEYHRMLGDIFEDTLALLALTGHRVGFERGDRRPPGIARLSFLLDRFTEIEEVLRTIDRAPWLAVGSVAEVADLSRAGRVRPIELHRASRRGRPVNAEQTACMAPSGRRLVEALGGRLPGRVQRRRARPSSDRREHREMLGALQQWKTFLARAARSLAGADDAIAERRRSLRGSCLKLIRRIERVEALPLFEGLTPKRGPLEHSHLYQRVPVYRRFHRAWSAFNAGLAAVSGDFLDLPLGRTFELYEQWVFLRLLRAAVSLDGSGNWRDGFTEGLDGTGLSLTLRGRGFAVGGLEFFFQRSFSEVWRASRRGRAGVGSYSHAMQPDVTIEAQHQPGTTRTIVVVDAKYRAGKQVERAVSELHKYTDAIVRVGPDGGLSAMQRAVGAAFVATPAAEPDNLDGQEWRQETSPGIFFSAGYHATFGFGAVSIRPGISLAGCRDLLQRILDASRCGPTSPPFAL